MNDTERALRKAMNELLHIVRMNDFMKKANSEFGGLLDCSHCAVEMLENTQESEKFKKAKESFATMLDGIKNSFGNAAVTGAYNCFKVALDDSDFCRDEGIEKELSPKEKGDLFKRIFDLIVPKAESWDYEEDYYSYFAETLKEILMPTEEINTELEDICPYCDGVPNKIPKSEFFGPHSANGDGFVWGCECGAYAEMDERGKVLGSLGDALLHQKRNLVKGAICELCKIAGLTVFESYRWFSLVMNKRLNSLADVEYLDVDCCNLALHSYIVRKKLLQEAEFDYPKDKSELFLFLTDGGRLSVCNAFGFQYGKLLIPSEIGPGGIRIYGKESSETISFSDTLRYEFKGNEMYIQHPSGKKEKFRMMPALMRSLLFEFKEVNPADVAG